MENKQNCNLHINDENYYKVMQEENKRYYQRANDKPSNPKPPANVKKTATVEKKSVYDEIAQRYKNIKRKSVGIGKSSDFDNMLLSEEETERFIDKVNLMSENSEHEEHFDENDDDGLFVKRYRTRMWAVLIGSLVFFCILTACMYFYINGYFDVWLK